VDEMIAGLEQERAQQLIGNGREVKKTEVQAPTRRPAEC
jgi:hypothetical protein